MAGKNEFSRLPDIPACTPPESRDFLNAVRGNETNVLAPTQQIVEAIFGDTLTNIVNQGDYANEFATIVNQVGGGAKRVELTADMTTGSAQVKLLEWSGSSYVVSGSAFTAYDTFDRWSHAKDGDSGFVMWDVERNGFVIVWLDTPMVRRGTLTAALVRDGDVDMTDADDASTVEVNGYFVPTGKKIPSGARVKATYNTLAKVWYVDVVDRCVVAA